MLRAITGEADRSVSCHACWTCELPGDEALDINVPHRLFYPFSILDGDRDVLEIILKKDAILLRRPDHLGSQDAAMSLLAGGEGDAIELVSSVVLPAKVKKQGFAVRMEGPIWRQVKFNFEEAVS